MNSSYIINKVLSEDNDPKTNGLNIPKKFGRHGDYWSSTEYTTNAGYLLHLSRNLIDLDKKETRKSVRAIRSF